MSSLFWMRPNPATNDREPTTRTWISYVWMEGAVQIVHVVRSVHQNNRGWVPSPADRTDGRLAIFRSATVPSVYQRMAACRFPDTLLDSLTILTSVVVSVLEYSDGCCVRQKCPIGRDGKRQRHSWFRLPLVSSGLAPSPIPCPPNPPSPRVAPNGSGRALIAVRYWGDH